MHLCSWIFPSQPYLLAICRSCCPLACCPKSRLHHSLARSHIDSSVVSARSVKIALSLSEHRRIPCITCGKRLTSSHNLWWSEQWNLDLNKRQGTWEIDKLYRKPPFNEFAEKRPKYLLYREMVNSCCFVLFLFLFYITLFNFFFGGGGGGWRRPT